MTVKDKLPKLQLKSVKTIDLSIISPKVKLKTKVEFTVNIKTEFLVNIDKNVFAIRPTISLIDSAKKIITSIKTENYFEIEDLNQYLKKDDSNSIELPESLLSALMNISIGTARGILLAKVGGTALDQLVLPIIPTKSLMPVKPIKFK